MTNPCKGEGATHFACDCFIERMAKLEKVAEAAKARLEVWNANTYHELVDALAALEEK